MRPIGQHRGQALESVAWTRRTLALRLPKPKPNTRKLEHSESFCHGGRNDKHAAHIAAERFDLRCPINIHIAVEPPQYICKRNFVWKSNSNLLSMALLDLACHNSESKPAWGTYAPMSPFNTLIYETHR